MASAVPAEDIGPGEVVNHWNNRIGGRGMTQEIDLVKALRQSQPKGTKNNFLLNDAADEIERLRKLVENLSKNSVDPEQVARDLLLGIKKGLDGNDLIRFSRRSLQDGG